MYISLLKNLHACNTIRHNKLLTGIIVISREPRSSFDPDSD